MSYRLHPEAALEHERQVAYYRERSVDLGRRYRAAMLQAVGKAVEFPHRYRIVRAPNLRSVGLQRFPYAVIYRPTSGEIQVLAVAHHRRSPDYWASRA